MHSAFCYFQNSVPALALILMLMVVSGRLGSAQGDVVTVTRSGEGDMVEFCSSEGSCVNESCASGDFTTYLVADKECVNDTSLITQSSK